MFWNQYATYNLVTSSQYELPLSVAIEIKSLIQEKLNKFYQLLTVL